MDDQQHQLPLFSERARSGDPATSHTRAGKLDGSLKLAIQAVAVLDVVRCNPGKNARELGKILYKETGNFDALEWPHKVMSKLRDNGFIVRQYAEHGLLCSITEDGKKILENL